MSSLLTTTSGVYAHDTTAFVTTLRLQYSNRLFLIPFCCNEALHRVRDEWRRSELESTRAFLKLEVLYTREELRILDDLASHLAESYVLPPHSTRKVDVLVRTVLHARLLEMLAVSRNNMKRVIDDYHTSVERAKIHWAAIQHRVEIEYANETLLLETFLNVTQNQ